MTDAAWRMAVQEALGARLHQWQRLGGGDFAQSWRAVLLENSASQPLARGDFVFVKTHGNPPPEHFSTEALGLNWLAETNVIAVPAVYGVSDDPPFLALQWVDEGVRSASADVAFGAALAHMHAAPCSHFGRTDERSTGSLGLPNKPSLQWAEFFATQRLLPLAQIAHDRQALNAQTVARLERLADRLSDYVALETTPSRLHGDLWAGNRLVDTAGRNWLIDPACHGGHREFDLAMMRLFGGFGDGCFASYQERYPLPDDWQFRVSLHQLAPLVVHAIKFGGSYVAPIQAALARYV